MFTEKTQNNNTVFLLCIFMPFHMFESLVEKYIYLWLALLFNPDIYVMTVGFDCLGIG